MKQTILIAAMMLAASVSQAKTMCTVNNSTSKKDRSTYDHSLFYGEISGHRSFVIKKGASAAVEVNLDQLTTFDEWKAINGAAIVILDLQKNGEPTIAVAHVDLSKGDNNAMPLDALTAGAVTEQQFLTLSVPAKNLSIICLKQ